MNLSIGDKFGALVLGGNVIPTVATACTNCGYISMHAAMVLGISPEEPDAPTEENADPARDPAKNSGSL
jgi:hypothetical protein